MLYGLDPNDPRYKELVRQMMRSGTISPMTMESQVNEAMSAPVSQAMIDQSADGAREAALRRRSQSLKGQEGKIAQQRAMAAQMRNRGTPQGRTVGPYDVYMGPNAGEVLEHAAGQLGGAWIGRKANEADTDLDKQRTQIAFEKAMEEDARYNEGLDLKVRAADLADAEFQQSGEQFEAELAQAVAEAEARAADSAATRKIQQARLDFDTGKMDEVVIQNVADPTQTKRVIRDSTGVLWEKGPDGKPAQTITGEGWIDFSSGTAGSTSNAATLADKLMLKGVDAENQERLARLKSELQEGREISKEDREWMRAQEAEAAGAAEEAAAEVRTADTTISGITEVLDSPYLAQLTGATNPERLKVLFSRGPDSEQLSVLNKRIENVANVPILEYLQKVKPATEGEYRVARTKVPTANDLPMVHVEYHAGNTYQDLRDAHEWAVEKAKGVSEEAGAEAQAQMDADLKALESTIVRGAIQYNLPPSTLRNYGFPEKAVKLVELMQKKKREAQ